MARFILNQNQQPTGDYEVHNKSAGCSYMPQQQNQLDLGEHQNCHGAGAYAKSKWHGYRINGCFYCCNPCHTT